ncbi:MAG: asparagine synthase (glutamine-hydrolyzing) [Chitinophagaceae bacterium]|nr:MAG: asparagine synthase (glutamine-hydrolyzing) [Chitinophagaceae bacterium]
MCGIAGFADITKKSGQQQIQAITATLQHRGPDGNSTYFVETPYATIGLGHCRLSIIDLSSCGTQPMHFENLHMVFNGEIYNYQEIRDELEGLGHQFVSHSDTEVILHSVKQWGYEAAIAKWHGMFAIVIYDDEKQEIVAIRDRAGVKPLYYYFNNGIFLFGSELKALVAHPAFERKVNKDAVASFLQYGYVPYPHCIWQNTFKLSQGHLLKLDLKAQGIHTSQYWNVYDYYNKPKLKISFSDAVTETEKILQKAFQYRMVADVPVGVFLSGGYDSSCVTALLQKNSTEKIKTFTIGTLDKQLDEAPYAKQIASHLGTDHTEYYCTVKEGLDIIPDLPYYYDEPFADSSAIPTILVSRLARKKVTVALSADAGDETFAGYTRYEYLLKYGGKINQIPAPARKLLAKSMSLVPGNRIPILSKKRNFHHRYEKLQNLLLDPSPEKMMLGMTQAFSDREIAKLFSKGVTYLDTAHRSKELMNDDKLSYMLAVDYQTYMCDDILQKVDRATMSTSLEGREPFLDQDVIEWAAQLPSDYKYHNGEKKYILKQIVHKYLPKEMMERPKMGFAIPIVSWLNNELKDLVHEHLNEEAIAAHGLFNASEVSQLVQEFFNGRTERHLKIWYLLMFQMWYKKWAS